jgi:hypothetical protein
MTATLSECGRYRYTLERWIPQAGSNRLVVFIGINPSTADANTDDHTVRKWCGFAGRWGYGHIAVVNLFAYRSTDVRELARVEDPVGPENDDCIRSVIGFANLLVPCWGNVEKVPGWKAKQLMRDRIVEVRALLRSVDAPVRIFGRTNKGDPKHPLTLSYETQLQDWTP